MDWQDRITIDPAILIGKPIIKGTRLAVEFIIDLRHFSVIEEHRIRMRPLPNE